MEREGEEALTSIDIEERRTAMKGRWSIPFPIPYLVLILVVALLVKFAIQHFQRVRSV